MQASRPPSAAEPNPPSGASGLPPVSVIIPSFNAESTLDACLRAVAASQYPVQEVIVVDDGSTDRTAEIASSHGHRVLGNKARLGPAYSRNIGAMAAVGEILVFVDADVVVNPDAISRAVDCLLPEDADAVFGSYVEEAGVPGFLNRFKNYQHHFVHQHGPDEPTSFWSGCGALKRSTFMAVGGFAAELKFCEDIEFGDALVRGGYRIHLLKQMQASHLKHYNFLKLVKSDLLGRAIPWTRLLRTGRSRFGNLNTNRQGVASVALTAAAYLGVFGAFFVGHLAWVTLAAWGGLAGVNRDFLAFGARRRGLAFLPGCFCMLIAHYTICGVGYIAGHLSPLYPAKRSPMVSEPPPEA
jgi:GT2 family glycosyltransferase